MRTPDRDAAQLDALQRKYGKREGLRAFREAEYGRLFADLLVPDELAQSERVRLALEGRRSPHGPA